MITIIGENVLEMVRLIILITIPNNEVTMPKERPQLMPFINIYPTIRLSTPTGSEI